jgi:DNA-binding HxlR family transcriptional regulator
MAAALEMFGRKWALRVIWELRVGPLNFRALQAACEDVSPSVLQRRLHGLRRLALIEKIPRLGYRLSARGERLFQVLVMLNKWSGDLRADPHLDNNVD